MDLPETREPAHAQNHNGKQHGATNGRSRALKGKKAVNHRNQQCGQQIPHTKFFPKGNIDTHTEDQCRTNKGNIIDQGSTHKVAKQCGKTGDASLIYEQGKGRENDTLAQSGCKNEYDYKVKDCFCGKGRIITGKTVLDRAHNCHGTDADDKSGGDEAFHELLILFRVKLFL